MVWRAMIASLAVDEIGEDPTNVLPLFGRCFVQYEPVQAKFPYIFRELNEIYRLADVGIYLITIAFDQIMLFL